MNWFNRIFFPKDNNPEHFKALDGLRGIAAFLVVLAHASGAKIHFAPFLDFTNMGFLGVLLFFMLSAYLLDRQIALAIKEKRATLRYWLNYALRRFLRIYPLYFAALLFNYFLWNHNKLYAYSIHSYELIVKHLLLQDGKGVFWSIPVEFTYYLLSPLILLFIDKVIKWNILNVVLFLLFLTAGVSYYNTIFFPEKISTLKYLPVFLVGTILSLVEVFTNTFKSFTARDKRTLDILAILAILLLLSVFKSVYQVFIGTGWPFHKLNFYIFYAILWVAILIAAKYSKGIIYHFLAFKPIRFLGVISFSLYLFHWPVLLFIQHSGFFADATKIYAFIILSVLFSTITYLLIERPFLNIRLGKKTKPTTVNNVLNNKEKMVEI